MVLDDLPKPIEASDYHARIAPPSGFSGIAALTPRDQRLSGPCDKPLQQSCDSCKIISLRGCGSYKRAQGETFWLQL